jgi:hypothetical protein
MGSYVELKIVGPGESLAAQCTRIWFFLAKQNKGKKKYLNNFRSGFIMFFYQPQNNNFLYTYLAMKTLTVPECFLNMYRTVSFVSNYDM